MNFTQKQIIVIVSIIIIIVIIAFYMTYKAGQDTSKPSTTKIPKKITGDLTDEEVENLRSLAINLFNDMDGINIGWDGNLYNKVNLLDNRKLVGLSNIYNYIYENQTGETLLQWFKNEKFYFDSFSLQNLVDGIIKKMQTASLMRYVRNF